MNNILFIIIAIIIGTYFLSLIISLLDFYYKPNNSMAKKYSKSKIKFDLISSSYSVIILLIIIFTKSLNSLDIFIRTITQNQILAGLLFFGAIGLFTFIIGLPFNIFNTFVIEKKYNFNKTTKKTFIIDIFKNLLLFVTIGAVVLSIILYIFQKVGGIAWLYCWIAITLIQIFTLFIYPIFILPIYNKLKILQDSPLKDAIKKYLENQNLDINMDNIKTIDSSTRTNKSNAFLTGIGKSKMLVLSDTLLKNHTLKEIVAIVAHEVGHYKMKHIIKHFGLSSIKTFLIFYLLSFIINNNHFFTAFGVENLSTYMGLILFFIIYSPIAIISSTITNYYSRKFEHNADTFSAKTTSPKDIVKALKKLGSDNLSNPNPHPLSVFLEYSHPPIPCRIKRLMK